MVAINRRHSRPIYVPQEVCGLIRQELHAATGTKRDLMALCFVAPGFREEVERLLYVFVGLQGKDNILSFCSAINHRPDLMARMRKLVISMPPQMCFNEAEFSAISQMLHASTALEDLRVLCQSPRLIGTSMNGWILDLGGACFQARHLCKHLLSFEVGEGFSCQSTDNSDTWRRSIGSELFLGHAFFKSKKSSMYSGRNRSLFCG
ncbi:hypothetical protein BDN70DRAFT_550099 [Pholiota conissans]|uniref:Uncharacterized protein n=1 Tax=Pholiota conissans TaxID=109636 RepID=A0A9P5Z4G8_9AGAR|nr:hypothetical protein BDN70DRAFT_550099 [Pholiota conissans]